jgi:hypothetical protein
MRAALDGELIGAIVPGGAPSRFEGVCGPDREAGSSVEENTAGRPDACKKHGLASPKAEKHSAAGPLQSSLESIRLRRST